MNRPAETSPDSDLRVLLVTGPSGAGKTTAGMRLAETLGWTFIDADDYHDPANIERMRQGGSLDDADRGPWLQAIRERLLAAQREGERVVLACSALKRRYREELSEGVEGVRAVLLAAKPEVLEARLLTRQGHFAGATLLPSQLATLETGNDLLLVDAEQPIGDVVIDVLEGVGLRTRPES